MEENKIISVEYPILANKTSKWTPEFRRQWNKEYRQKIKNGEVQPVKRKDEPSKWDDPEFRKAYDDARLKKLAEEKLEKKMSFEEIDKRPNYTLQEKQVILSKLLDMVKNGQDPYHPYFQIGLLVKPEVRRVYPKKNETEKKESFRD